jgi:hypothetical protein
MTFWIAFRFALALWLQAIPWPAKAALVAQQSRHHSAEATS